MLPGTGTIDADWVNRVLDAILPHKEAVEKHRCERLGTLSDPDWLSVFAAFVAS